MRIALAIAATCVSWVGSASASDWYRGAFCDLSACLFSRLPCHLSHKSPATIYENNQRYADASIIEDGGRVEVKAHHLTWVLFRTQEACSAYVTSESRRLHDLEAQRKKATDRPSQ
jgi:hypothetical protein